MVSSFSASCPPSSATVGYSKICSTSSSSSSVGGGVKYSKVGLAEDRGNQQVKPKACCGGCKGYVVACVAAAIGVCLLLVLLVDGRHSRFSLHNPRSGSSSPSPSPSYLPYYVSTSPSPSPSPSPAFAPLQPPSLTSLCNTTKYPRLCLTTLSSYSSPRPSAFLQDLTAYVASAALIVVNQTYWLGVNLSRGSSEAGGSGEMAVLQDCLDLLDGARDGLSRSIERLSHLNGRTPAAVMDVRVWLSSSYTDQDTCWDEFEETEGPVKERMSKQGQPIVPLLAIALSFAETLQQIGPSTVYALQGASVSVSVSAPAPAPAAS